MRTLFCLLAISLFTVSAHAQTLPAGSEPGQIERRLEETAEPRSLPKVTRGLESTTAPEVAASTPLIIRKVRLVGSTIYSDDDIRSFYEPYIGTKTSLSQVFSIAAQITAQYGRDGFLLSRVIVPPQAS